MAVQREKAKQPITDRAAECIERCLHHSRKTHPNLTEARKWNVRLLREHLDNGAMSAHHANQAAKTIRNLENHS